jgi:hypothetical protein
MERPAWSAPLRGEKSSTQAETDDLVASIEDKLGVGKFGWAIADQALSSATNFLLNLAAARSLSPGVFGALTLAFSAYLIILGISRALGSEPLTVHFSNTQPPRMRRAISDAAGSALVIGLVLGGGMVVIGWTQGDPVRDAFIGIGLFMPGLLLQDSWRLAFFAKSNGRGAFSNDLVWAVLLVPLVAFLLTSGRGSVLMFALAWGATGTAAGLVGLLQLRLFPDPRRAFQWWKQERHLATRYLGEFAALSGGGQASTYSIAVSAGLQAVGNIRASFILLGPLNVLFMGTSAVAVPHAVRVARVSGGRLHRFAIAVSLALATAPLVWAFILLAAPAAWGEVILGGTWSGARKFLLPAAVAMAGSGASAGAATALRGLAAARSSLRARILAALAVVAAALTGGLVAGGLGAAWGLAVGSWLAALSWWRHLSGALIEARRNPTAEG